MRLWWICVIAAVGVSADETDNDIAKLVEDIIDEAKIGYSHFEEPASIHGASYGSANYGSNPNNLPLYSHSAPRQPSYGYGVSNPTSSGYGAAQNGYGSASVYSDPGPPAQGYGSAGVPTAWYNEPKPQAQGYNPGPAVHGYGAANQPSPGYGVPSPPSHGHAAPYPPSHQVQGYAAPSPAQSGYGTPTAHVQTYGAPVSNGYNKPSSHSIGYGNPSPPAHGYHSSSPPVHGYNNPSPPVHGYNNPSPPVHGYNNPSPPVHGYNNPSPPVHGYNNPSPPVGGYGVAGSPVGGYHQPHSPPHGYPVASPPAQGYATQFHPAHGASAPSYAPSHAHPPAYGSIAPTYPPQVFQHPKPPVHHYGTPHAPVVGGYGQSQPSIHGYGTLGHQYNSPGIPSAYFAPPILTDIHQTKSEVYYLPVSTETKGKKKKKRKIITVYKGYYIAGGTQLFGKFKTLKACEKACAFTPNCFAGDYNPYTKKCYSHSNYTACGPLRAHTSLIHFKKVPCAIPEAPQGRVMLGVQIHLGLEVKAKDLTDCLKKCATAGQGIQARVVNINLQICFGIDYDFSNHKCYFHVNNNVPPNHFCPLTGLMPGVPRDAVPNPSVVSILLCPGP